MKIPRAAERSTVLLLDRAKGGNLIALMCETDSSDGNVISLIIVEKKDF